MGVTQIMVIMVLGLLIAYLGSELMDQSLKVNLYYISVMFRDV